MERTEQKVKARMNKQLGRHLADAKWSWNGTQFYWHTTEVFTLHGERSCVRIRFTAKVNYLSICIELNEKFGLPDEEQSFVGEDAIEKAISWETDVLYKVLNDIAKRTEPYVQGRENYLLALKGVL